MLTTTNRHFGAAAAAAVLLGLTVSTSAYAEGSEGEESAQAAVERVEPVGVERTDLALTEIDGSFRSEATDLVTIVPRSSENSGVQLSDPNAESAPSMIVGLPELDLSTGDRSSDKTSVVFTDDEQNVDVVVQVQSDAAQIATVLRDSNAPEEFRYPITVPAGGVVRLADGLVTVTDHNDHPVGYVAPPWAKDAAGDSVPTSFRLDGDTLVQTVEHQNRGFEYPIVADPYIGRDLIKSARWDYIERNGAFGAGRTLRVTVTDWAWTWSGAGEANHKSGAAQAGWNELRAKYPSLNRHLGAMKDQYVCHAEYAAAYYGKDRPTWNLDEWRPDVSYIGTVRYKCNPPAGGPYRY